MKEFELILHEIIINDGISIYVLGGGWVLIGVSFIVGKANLFSAWQFSEEKCIIIKVLVCEVFEDIILLVPIVPKWIILEYSTVTPELNKICKLSLNIQWDIV